MCAFLTEFGVNNLANERAGFMKLLGPLENGDLLVVTKLDRLGRNSIDVRTTVELISTAVVREHCLPMAGLI